MRILSTPAAGLAMCLIATPATATEPAACRTVRLAQTDWTDTQATTAVAATLLRGLGYVPRTTTLSVPTIYEGLRRQRVDAFLGDWEPGMAADRKADLEAHVISVVGPILTGAVYGLAVPTYLYDTGLHSFGDIVRFGAQLDHKILAIDPGNPGNERLAELIRQSAFGLGDFRLVESSADKMLADVEKATKTRQPVLFLAWQPHWMNLDVKLTYLAGGEAVFGPDQGAASVFADARAAWLDTCPNAARLLRNLTFTLPAVDAMMASIRVQHRSPETAALDWILDNAAVMSVWLDGVNTWDGQPGEASVRTKFGR